MGKKKLEKNASGKLIKLIKTKKNLMEKRRGIFSHNTVKRRLESLHNGSSKESYERRPY